jgi:hypothetical protein
MLFAAEEILAAYLTARFEWTQLSTAIKIFFPMANLLSEKALSAFTARHPLLWLNKTQKNLFRSGAMTVALSPVNTRQKGRSLRR